MAIAQDRIVLGASAGGVESLVHLVQTLPAHLPAALFIVVHFPTDSTSVLPQILSRHGKLPAIHPNDGQPIENGMIYVAPPDRHLVLDKEVLRVVHSPKVNGHRPAIDPLFQSAGRVFGRRAVGVILSGLQDDGVRGLQVIKNAGGVTIAQDPSEALFASMPLNAIEKVAVDFVLPLTQIAAKVSELAHNGQAAEGETLDVERDSSENDLIQRDIVAYEDAQFRDTASVLTCPECGGVLWELRHGELVEFRCHVGHVYSGETMLAEQGAALESALWVAVRSLEERASLLRRMARDAQARGGFFTEQRFRQQADAVEQNAALIRAMLLNGKNAVNRPGSDSPGAPHADLARGASASPDS